MAMHQGFDLSRFKKVSSDDASTTMRHSNGHEVKIVHSALSPKMREQIEALPMQAPEPQKMARGGMVKKMAEGGDPADPEAMDPASPATADDLPPGADMTAVNAASRPAGIPPPPEHDDADSDAAPAMPHPKPEVPTIDVTGAKAPPTMPELESGQAAWHHDLQNGHITPQTYEGLFAKKDTLGKVGTLFGLIVGGAGAGLLHQENPVMEMMNRTIQNDLDAQRASKSNAVNYYNAAVNMLQGTANAENVASHTALNNMRVSVYQHLFDNVANKAPGPYQQKAMAMLQQMLPAIGAQNTKDNAKAVLSAHQQTGGQGAQPTFNGPVNTDVLAAGNLVAPEVFGPALKEGTHVAQTRQLFDNYKQSWERLNTITAGQTPQMVELASKAAAGFIPMEGLNQAAADMAKHLMGERQAQIDSMPGVPESFLPSGFDFMPGGGAQKARDARRANGARWFSLQEGQTPNLGMLQRKYNVMTPQPYESWASSKQKDAPTGEMHIGLDSSGLHVHQKGKGKEGK